MSNKRLANLSKVNQFDKCKEKCLKKKLPCKKCQIFKPTATRIPIQALPKKKRFQVCFKMKDLPENVDALYLKQFKNEQFFKILEETVNVLKPGFNIVVLVKGRALVRPIMNF